MTWKNHKTPMLGLKKRRLPKSTNPINQLFQSIKPYIWICTICRWNLNWTHQVYIISRIFDLRSNQVKEMCQESQNKPITNLFYGLIRNRKNRVWSAVWYSGTYSSKCATTKLGTHIHPVPSEVLSNNVLLARQCSTLTWVIALKNVIYEEVSKNSLF